MLVREEMRDRWGEPTPGERIVVPIDSPPYPRRSVENNDNVTITGMTVILPPGSPVPTARDEIILWPQIDGQGQYVEDSGQRFNVHGDVGYWAFMDGDEAGIEVQLERGQ